MWNRITGVLASPVAFAALSDIASAAPETLGA
jgi:hypothetical protein